MDDIKNTSTEGTQTGTEGTQGTKTFTQEDVNRIVQERLAKEKSKAGNGEEELNRRAAELDLRERKLTAREKLRENGLPDYLVEALNMNTDEDFQKSIETILKMKGEASSGPKPIAGGNLIGRVQGTGGRGDEALLAAFGLMK